MLPCCECGGEPRVADFAPSLKKTYVYCLSCGRRTLEHKTRIGAIAAWDRRETPKRLRLL